jgi:hypothetical protein
MVNLRAVGKRAAAIARGDGLFGGTVLCAAQQLVPYMRRMHKKINKLGKA